MSLLVGELKSVIGLDTSKFDKGLDASEAKFRRHSKKLGTQAGEVAKQAGAGLAGAERSSFRLTGTLGRLGGVAGRASVGLGGIAKGAGIVGVAVSAVGGAVIGAGIKVSDYAGRLELLRKKSATVFGGELGRVQTWAKANAHAMGLTKGEAVGLSAGLADLLIPMGFSRKAAADMATSTVGLSGALAEWSGGTKTASEVTEILSAAFMGERDGLNALGISITQAEVDAALLAKGQDKLTGSQKQQAEATATQALIMAKSVDAQNAFAKGAGSVARNSAESRARLKEMAETMATKATPVLLKIGQAVNEDVLPALERFGGFLNENRFKIALFFVSIAEGVTSLVKTFGPAMKFLNNAYMTFIGNMVAGAAKAFGWIPEIGPKLKAASETFNAYQQGTNKVFDSIINKAGEWDTALEKTKKELVVKADIQDLESKLKTARKELSDKNLTKERRAQVTATIKDLESKLTTAHTKLDASWITKARVAKLQADKTDLENKITAAKTALGNPKLTATKKAKLTADIVSLQRQVNAAQTKIDSLKGKSVTVTLSAIVSKQFANVLSGRLDYYGNPIRGGAGGSGGSGGMGRVMRGGTYRVGVPWQGYAGHTGQDLPARTGTPVYAPFAGSLSNTNLGNRSYGRYVSIRNGQWQFIGAHLSRFARPGGSVGRGAVVGFTGSSGNSTGPHLHAEIRRNGRAINPRGVLPYKTGGWLMPGHLAYNETSRPEPVLNDRQWNAVANGQQKIVIEFRPVPTGGPFDQLFISWLQGQVRGRGGVDVVFAGRKR